MNQLSIKSFRDQHNYCSLGDPVTVSVAILSIARAGPSFPDVLSGASTPPAGPCRHNSTHKGVDPAPDLPVPPVVDEGVDSAVQEEQELNQEQGVVLFFRLNHVETSCKGYCITCFSFYYKSLAWLSLQMLQAQISYQILIESDVGTWHEVLQDDEASECSYEVTP